MVTGTHPALQVCEKAYIDRRKQCWTAWVDGHGNGSITATLYSRSHLPYIVVFFKHVWDVDLPSDISMDNAQELSSTVLEEVKNEIVDLLVKMFIIPSSKLEQLRGVRRSSRNSLDTEIPTGASPIKKKRRHGVSGVSVSEDDEDDDESEEDDPNNVMSCQLDLDKGPLVQLWTDKQCDRVGSLEIAAKEAHAGNDLMLTNAKISLHGGTPITISK